MAVEYTVISIGTLSHNRLWSEGAAVRAAHATSTLIVDGERRILVDPSLPAKILEARFNERTGGHLADVTDVFCTTLRPVHRRGLEGLDEAKWWVNELELVSYRLQLEQLLETAQRLSSDDATSARAEMELLEQFKPAPDKFSEQISLYPLIGPSPGSAGLLITPPTTTIAIAGDAGITAEHIERGQVWAGCVDTEAALESLQDLLDVADVIIPGHDNIVLTPRRQWL